MPSRLTPFGRIYANPSHIDPELWDKARELARLARVRIADGYMYGPNMVSSLELCLDDARALLDEASRILSTGKESKE